MSLLKKFLIIISSAIILTLLFSVVFKPVLSNFLIMNAKKYARGQYTCTVNSQGEHVGKLYKITKGEKVLQKTFKGNRCIFSRPKVNAGFFVLAIGAGGGATPYESGRDGEIISKHKRITTPVLSIQVGKGGNGTFTTNNKYFDAKDGEDTSIKDLKITAKGGFKSTRMTPLGKGHTAPKAEYCLPEKYRYLYDISKSAKYGAGGKSAQKTGISRTTAQDGQSGIVVIQW